MGSDEPTRLFGFDVEVIDDEETRRKLKQSFEELEGIVDRLNDAVFLHDRDGNLIYVNETVEERLGYSKAELLEMTPRDFDAPEWAGRFEERIETLEREGSLVFESVHVTRDGERIPVEINSATISFRGEPAILSVARDITERKERERELERSEARYRTLTDDVLDTSKVGTIILNGDFEVVWLNEAVETFFGIDREEVIGADKRQLIETTLKDSFEDPEGFAETILGTYDDNTYLEQFDCHVLPKAGLEERWLRHWSQPIESGLYDGGRIEHYTDITDRKERERRLELLNDQLLVLNRITRHDIRNDMTVAMGWGDELESHVDAAGKSVLGRIQNTHRHVVDLTKTLRDYVDALGSDEEPTLEPTDLGTQLADELSKRRSMHPDAVFSVEGDIPHVDVWANELLSSVFRNVLNNAVQHNDKDEPVVEIGVDVAEDTVEVTIADNGPGIPEDRKDRIFGRGAEGLDDPAAGIGLYLVDRLVGGYGGEIHVTANEPEGSVFSIGFERVR